MRGPSTSAGHFGLLQGMIHANRTVDLQHREWKQSSSPAPIVLQQPAEALLAFDIAGGEYSLLGRMSAARGPVAQSLMRPF